MVVNPATASYSQYIAYEIQGFLTKCIEKAQLDHHYFGTPEEPLIGEVGHVDSSKSNPVSGPFTKEIYIKDVYGKSYRITIEDLKEDVSV
jgi:hypothetical protein|tara:strand:- start:3163 stop:3432 length:270 start_codon:yes stop_codon:yes gene_type:complete